MMVVMMAVVMTMMMRWHISRPLLLQVHGCWNDQTISAADANATLHLQTVLLPRRRLSAPTAAVAPIARRLKAENAKVTQNTDKKRIDRLAARVPLRDAKEAIRSPCA